MGFLQLWWAEATLPGGAQPSPCSDFSCLGVQALEHGLSSCDPGAYLLSGMWNLPQLRSEYYFVTTHLPWAHGTLGRWILSHRTTRDAPNLFFFPSVFKDVIICVSADTKVIHVCVKLHWSQWNKWNHSDFLSSIGDESLITLPWAGGGASASCLINT